KTSAVDRGKVYSLHITILRGLTTIHPKQRLSLTSLLRLHHLLVLSVLAPSNSQDLVLRDPSAVINT
ncbi:unnamed protein product, partial [marine sediment metagenome]